MDTRVHLASVINNPDLANAEPDSTPGEVRRSQLVETPAKTARNIYKISTHIPLDLWPDLLVIDEVKVSVINRRPFDSELIRYVLVKDISDVQVNSIPFFASLQISGGDYKLPDTIKEGEVINRGPLSLGFLHKPEAAEARRLILGLVIMLDQKVDTSKMSLTDLTHKAEDLGRAR